MPWPKWRFSCFALLDELTAGSQRFVSARAGAAAVEFAFASLALFLFLLAIINLGYLGLTLAALQHGVQGGARTAAVNAAAHLPNNGNPANCPSGNDVRQYFNSFASPPLPLSSGSTTDGSPVLYATTSFSPMTQTQLAGDDVPWTSNTANMPPGTFIVLTAKYTWKPIGFASFPTGVNLSLTAAAFVLGTGPSTTC